MLRHPVVVADDGAGAEVRTVPKPGIPDIGEMIGLGTVLDHRFLDLDEITDMHFLTEPRAGPQSGIGSDPRTLAHVRLLEMRERTDHRIILDHDARPEYHKWLDHDIAPEFGICRQKHRLRRDQRDA